MGTGMCLRRPSRHPQIQPTEQAARVTRRRSRGTSPVAPESLPSNFNDDLLREILIRLPPEPSSLPRASAVCRRWRGLVTDPKFIRRFRAHHRKPPLLGVFQDTGIEGIMFTPVLDCIPPNRFSIGGKNSCHGLYSLLDCRHGLVLIKDTFRNQVAVCDPITGEQHYVSVQSELISRGDLKGAVLCTAGDPHGGCHLSSYKVILVSMSIQCVACVYSFETGAWGDLIPMKTPFFADHVPAALVGNCLYWTIGNDMLKFDLDRHDLAVIMGPPATNFTISGNRQVIQGADGALGCAILSYPQFQMWQRNINGHGVATWVLWKSIEMHTTVRLLCPINKPFVRLLCCDEDVVLLRHDESVYIVQLKPMQSKKLNIIHYTGNRYFPFKSFFTPAIAGGVNGVEMLHIG